MKYKCTVFICFFIIIKINAQSAISGHSHNDYAQKHPFSTAFAAKMASIEADVHLINNALYVAHDKEDIKTTRTLDNLYLKPLSEALQSGNFYPLVLLIDIKSQADSTLDEIVKQIARYPIFTAANSSVNFIISGNRPLPENWSKYPYFIQFDGRPTEVYTPSVLARVGMISQSFEKYTSKKNQKNIDGFTYKNMENAVKAIHAQGKKVRFWATPDKKKVWQALAKMGVDFINTDKPKALRRFLNKKISSFQG